MAAEWEQGLQYCVIPTIQREHLCLPEQVVELLDQLESLDLVVIDESFLDFARVEDIRTVAQEGDKRENVIVLKSLGKNFGLHGLRAGYAVANPHLARLLRDSLPKWNFNAMAQALVRALPENWEHYESSRIRVIEDRNALFDALRAIPGLTVYPSGAILCMYDCPRKWMASLAQSNATHHGILLRDCGSKIGATSNYFRIVARPQHETRILIQALKQEMQR